jgi:cell wall-associated NlpC family hydrolase
VIQQDSTKAIFQDTIPKKSNPQVDAIINYAKTFLGVPYRYGGTTPSGFDCSGFINFIFGNFGFSLVRTSYGLAELGETVALSDIQPGDLLFFKGSNVNSTSVGHVAMVIEVKDGSFKFIHSANGGVQITNFNTSRYYIQRYVKAKRLDYGGY